MTDAKFLCCTYMETGVRDYISIIQTTGLIADAKFLCCTYTETRDGRDKILMCEYANP